MGRRAFRGGNPHRPASYLLTPPPQLPGAIHNARPVTRPTPPQRLPQPASPGQLCRQRYRPNARRNPHRPAAIPAAYRRSCPAQSATRPANMTPPLPPQCPAQSAKPSQLSAQRRPNACRYPLRPANYVANATAPTPAAIRNALPVMPPMLLPGTQHATPGCYPPIARRPNYLGGNPPRPAAIRPPPNAPTTRRKPQRPVGYAAGDRG